MPRRQQVHHFITGDVIIPLSHIFSHRMSYIDICWVEDLSQASSDTPCSLAF